MRRLAIGMALVVAMACGVALGQATQAGGAGEGAALLERIGKLQGQLEGLTGSRAVDQDRVRARLGEINGQIEGLLPSIAGKKARLEAIKGKMREVTEGAQVTIGRDAVLEELKRSAKTREEAVERLRGMVDRSLATPADLEAAVNAAAESRVRLEERKEYLMNSAAGGSLPALQKEMVDVSLDISEQTGALESLVKRQKDLREALGVMREIEGLAHEAGGKGVRVPLLGE